MKSLLFGVSSQTSLGYFIGEHLRSAGHEVHYASRSGRIGHACDVTDVAGVQRLVGSIRPQLLVHAAGIFLATRQLGQTGNWQNLQKHLSAKSIGSVILVDAAVRFGSVSQFIAIGGRAVSADPTYIAYTCGNGALFAAVQFANRHTSIKSYMLDLPLVDGSAIGDKFLSASREQGDRAGGIGVERVMHVVDDIVSGREQRERIVVGAEQWSV